MEYLNGWTKEKVREQVKKEFKGKSVDLTRNKCLYRGPYNKKCIAGCFIHDEEYDPKMDEMLDARIGYITKDFGLKMPLNGDSMNKWQYIHDSLDVCLTVERQTEILLEFLDK